MENDLNQDLMKKDPPKKIVSFEDKYEKPLKIKRLVVGEKVILCNGQNNQECTLSIDQIEKISDTSDKKDAYPLWEIKVVNLSSNEEEIRTVNESQINSFISKMDGNFKPKSQQISDRKKLSFTVAHKQEFTRDLDGHSRQITSLVCVRPSNISINVTIFLSCGNTSQDDKVIMDECDTKIEIATFEILDRLKLKCFCGALDFNFWCRKDNEKTIWSPLLDHLELHMISKVGISIRSTII